MTGPVERTHHGGKVEMNARIKLLTTGLTALFVLTLVGCMGEIGAPPAPDEKVASLTFVADADAALVNQSCQSPNDCRLPNQHLCVKLEVAVYGDGHTVGTCWLRSGQTRLLQGTGEGIPLKCRSHTGQYAVHCLDANNNVAVDGTGQGIAVYPTRSPSWYKTSIGNHSLGDNAAYLEESGPGEDLSNPGNNEQQPNDQVTPPEETPEQKALKDKCRQQAIDAFNSSFQAVINNEGLSGIHYQPAPPSNTSGFYGNGDYQNDATQLCMVQVPSCKKKTHWSEWFGGGNNFQWYGGGCYCSVTNYGPSCYTSQMITAAKAQACNQKPPDCDITVWNTGVQDATVPAKQFVDQQNKTTDTKAGVVEGIKAGATLLSLLGSIGSFGGTNNYGSPLVLDLGDDGLALTSAAAGVEFNLTGAGAVRTAWVAGDDDALLAIDLDGNGRVDSGAELFGEDTRLDGFAGGNGFQALAALDSPQNGGNGNGLVEADDVMYAQLLLWRDRNRDGVSQASELTSARAAGVQALSTAATEQSTFDRHGNDLSARGSFLRADGTRGLMVDVYFIR
jgi:hypothetical protein